MFAVAAKSLGYHPFPSPVGVASAAYMNPEGVCARACEYCGYCKRIACETNAKASANSTVMPALWSEPKLDLGTHAYVARLLYDRASKKVTGVLYKDTRTGESTRSQPASSCCRHFVFSDTQHLLLAGIGEPRDPATGRGCRRQELRLPARPVALRPSLWRTRTV
jgi:gluconate 2-dehydrogenase alpha chain